MCAWHSYVIFQAHVPSFDRLGRGKMSIAVDLKRKEGASVIKKLCNKADVLIEPFRVGRFTSRPICVRIIFLSCYGHPWLWCLCNFTAAGLSHAFNVQCEA